MCLNVCIRVHVYVVVPLLGEDNEANKWIFELCIHAIGGRVLTSDSL